MCIGTHIHTLCVYTYAKIYLDVTETTHNSVTQSIGKHNTAKYFRPLIMPIDTLTAIVHCALRDLGRGKWTDGQKSPFCAPLAAIQWMEVC